MKQRKQLWTGLLAGITMLLVILDARTAVIGASDGIQLCLQSVIPSLFPFLILSNLMNSALVGVRIPLLDPIRKLCVIPEGGESLLLLGLVGGYPVGAQAIASAYKNGQLQKKSAARMLGFCNNAGPAFIFGLVGTLYSSAFLPWVIWLIHMISALVVGAILPYRAYDRCTISTAKPMGVTGALEQALKIMANICGWVIVFRVVIAICSRWFFWLLPQNLQLFLIGLLELTNGITALHAVPHDGVRFVLSTCMLSIGGICVGMQTVSLTEGLDISMYFPGKLLQGIVSLLLSCIAQVFLFDHNEILHLHAITYIALLAIMTFTVWLLNHKKSSSKLETLVV